MSDGKKRMLKSLAFGIGAGLFVFGLRATASLAQEPTPTPPSTQAAEPAPAPAAPEPKGPDPTGAVTGTAADVPVKDAAKPTLVEVMETVGHNKIAINITWTLLTGFLVMFMQTG
ncbi:MAG TPA: ammonium transporter, partial [Vicinamibacteria bacterium]